MSTETEPCAQDDTDKGNTKSIAKRNYFQLRERGRAVFYELSPNAMPSGLTQCHHYKA